VAISPEDMLVTGSQDGTARLWDLTAKDPAADPVVLRGHRSGITAVALSPNNSRLITGSDDSTARLWLLLLLQMKDLIDLVRTIVGRNFSSNESQLYFPSEKYHKTFDELPGPDQSVTPKTIEELEVFHLQRNIKH
jgi:WD40 repeat protein